METAKNAGKNIGTENQPTWQVGRGSRKDWEKLSGNRGLKKSWGIDRSNALTKSGCSGNTKKVGRPKRSKRPEDGRKRIKRGKTGQEQNEISTTRTPSAAT